MTTTNEDLIAHARNLADPDQYKRLRAKDKRMFGKLADALTVTASTETAWRKAIADQVRRNCTPSSEAYAAGGDRLIYAVADWIENPPAWSSVTLPVLASSEYNEFSAQVAAERQRQIEKGYTAEHDDKRGLDHLLMWAQEYARRGEAVKSAALIEAARESMVRRTHPAVPAPTEADREALAKALYIAKRARVSVPGTLIWETDAEWKREEFRQIADDALATGLVPAPKTQDGEAREALEEDIHEAMLAEAMIDTRYHDGDSVEVIAESYVADVIPALARDLHAYGYRRLVPVSPEGGETK